MGVDLTGIGTAADAVTKVLGMFFPDKTEEDKAKMAQAFQVLQMQNDLARAQIAVNEETAKHGLTFRDGAGWVCVGAFGLNCFKPMIEWGCVLAGHPVVLPAMDTSTLTTMLFALLGIGGMHVYEATS